MNIASVIVDVSAKQIDKGFDYLIPERWRGIIEPGMRVVVPFGSRTIQGFVIGLKSTSSFNKLKEIIEPMDLSPVLNEEMLSLSDWLTEAVLCTKISAYQAMIPAALKAQYVKNIRLTIDSKVEDLSFELQDLLNSGKVLAWKDALKNNLIPLVKKEVAKGTLEVVYEVKERTKKKRLTYIFPALSKPQLIHEIEGLTNARKQKEVIDYFVENPEMIESRKLQTKLAVSQSTIKGLVGKGILVQQEREVYRDPYANREFKKTEKLPLTDQQQQAIIPILSSINHHRHDVFLLYGITGSGKTEIYLQSIQRVIEQGKEAIVLVPEISLTPQMVHRFKGRFGNKVAVMHSGLSSGEKYDEWRKIQRGQVSVVVGARSAVFAPFENLGIIIIDEEHETSYKQEENPRYHARDVAIHRARNYNCPVVLGSATPSLETFARADKKVYQKLTLSKRMMNAPLRVPTRTRTLPHSSPTLHELSPELQQSLRNQTGSSSDRGAQPTAGLMVSRTGGAEIDRGQKFFRPRGSISGHLAEEFDEDDVCDQVCSGHGSCGSVLSRHDGIAVEVCVAILERVRDRGDDACAASGRPRKSQRARWSLDSGFRTWTSSTKPRQQREWSLRCLRQSRISEENWHGSSIRKADAARCRGHHAKSGQWGK